MTEHDQTMALLLEQARADLAAARQRIAELEDWRRRAEPYLRSELSQRDPDGDDSYELRQLLREVKP